MTDSLSHSNKRYALVINTKSRKGAEWYKAASNALEKTNKRVVFSKAVRRTSAIDKVFVAALAARPDVIIVGGGDGTVSAAVRHFADTNVHCGFLPLGTTNNFARTAGIPLNFDDAMNVALHGNLKKFDVAQLNGRYFANVASLGLSSKIAQRVNNRLKKFIGRAAYALAGLRELLFHRPMKCVIEADGKTHTFTTHQLVVANGSYHSAVRIGDLVSGSSGQLVVFSMDDGNKLTLLKNFIRYNTSGITNLSGHEVIRARHITLTTYPRRRVEIDGELGTRTPVEITCINQALSVLVP